jgi:hypothetical protein
MKINSLIRGNKKIIILKQITQMLNNKIQNFTQILVKLKIHKKTLTQA